MERPDLERIKQGLFRLNTSNPIVKDFEDVLLYALQLEASRQENTQVLEAAVLKIGTLEQERDDARLDGVRRGLEAALGACREVRDCDAFKDEHGQRGSAAAACCGAISHINPVEIVEEASDGQPEEA